MSLRWKHCPWNSQGQRCKHGALRQIALGTFWKYFLTWETHPVIDSFAQKTFASKSFDKLLSVPISCSEAFPPKLGIKRTRAALGESDHEINAEGFRARRGKIISKGRAASTLSLNRKWVNCTNTSRERLCQETKELISPGNVREEELELTVHTSIIRGRIPGLGTKAVPFFGDGGISPFWTADTQFQIPELLSPHSDSSLISSHNLASQLLSL